MSHVCLIRNAFVCEMISYAGHLVTAIVGANDGDDRSNACVMLSHELESLLEPQFRGKSVECC